MNLTTAIRGAALVALFAAALPAPASAQLGFIKKQLKHKIIDAVVDSAANRVFGPAGDSAGGTRPTNAAPSAGKTRGAHTATAAPGPQFDDFVIEITPLSLDRLEKYLADQKADRTGSDRTTRRAVSESQQVDQRTMVQLGLMTQRVVAFCAATARPEQAGSGVTPLAASSGMLSGYTPAEAAALRPRCARLGSLLGDTP